VSTPNPRLPAPKSNRSLVIASCVVLLAIGAAQPHVRPIAWPDVANLRGRLEAAGLSEATFAARVAEIGAANTRRVREGDLDHLIFFALQSSRVARQPPIEPALSAKALVDSLTAAERQVFLERAEAPPSRVPAAARSRLAALLRVLDAPATDPRLTYFRELVRSAFPRPSERSAGLTAEYLRVMRFVYEKEFVAQRSPRAPEAVADLYRSRGLATDTAIEAGFMVHLGLGVIKSLQPDRRIRRVLIVGPGLDLAPRTGLLEEGPPESYQPWAVMDALLDHGLSDPATLEVVAADINPRVIEHLRRARTQPPALTLVSGIADSETVSLSAEYREYFKGLGRAIGDVESAAGRAGHLRKTVHIHRSAGRALQAERLDIVTERLEGARFDLIIATNILPYFGDVELALALSNVGSMLAEDGIFLHNEDRAALQEITKALGFPFEQSRHAIIAAVRGAPAPLFDSVRLHRKKGS
jgi:hypothetical protein